MSEWISVKDRMPDAGVPVLLWNVEGFAYVDTWSKFGCWTITPTTGEVTHWMPLPDPPKESEAATLTTDIEEFYKEAMKSSGRWNEPPESEDDAE